MDITMAGFGGFEATKKILQRNQKQKIIIMSMHDNPLFIEKAIDLGSSTFQKCHYTRFISHCH